MALESIRISSGSYGKSALQISILPSTEEVGINTMTGNSNINANSGRQYRPVAITRAASLTAHHVSCQE